METTGILRLSSLTAAALWNNEFTGQMSDGMWENTRPHDHWKFWCRLEVQVGTENRVTTASRWECKKTSYAFEKLIPIIGDRMLRIGQMAKATGSFTVSRGASEYMPATLEEWTECKASGKWEYDFVNKYMDEVTPEIAKAFYETVYTLKDLKADIKVIKSAIRTMAHPSERFLHEANRAV